MNDVQTERGLFLDRRAHSRVHFRVTARLVPDPNHPLRLGHALTQNLSLRGVSILSPVVLAKHKPFPIWIPVEGPDVVTATASVAWVTVEDTLGDSPYWICSGLALTYDRPKDRTLISDIVAERDNMERILKEQSDSKIGFVF